MGTENGFGNIWPNHRGSETTGIYSRMRPMSDETPQQVAALAPETVFQLLSHSTRYGLLECLSDHDETLALADASEEIARAVEDEPVQAIEADTVKRIYMALYHSHIPKLVDHDIVSYDQEHDLVALTERGHQLVEYLTRFEEAYRVVRNPGL